MKTNKINSVPSLSLLSPDLLNIYTSCDGVKKNLFKRIYKAVWLYLFPVSKLDDFILCYGLPKVLNSLAPSLTLSGFFSLCEVYFLTGGGVRSIDTRKQNFIYTDRYKFRILQDLNFIKRAAFDPIQPSNRCVQHVFISLCPAGKDFYHNVVKLLYSKSRKDLLTVM